MHAEGYCIFRFNTIADRDQVLQSGPYSYRNKPMVLKLWEVDFSLSSDVLSTIPVWFRFPGLPVGFWSTEALSKMASAIGKPLYTDKFTAHFEKISYARILVEIDAAYPLPDQIEIETPYGPKIQAIEYDWKPSFCNDCLKFGHDTMDCWYNTKCEAVQGIKERDGKEIQRNRGKKQGRNVRQTWIVKQPQVNADNQENEMTVQEIAQVVSNVARMNDSKERTQQATYVSTDQQETICKNAEMQKQIEKGKNIEINEMEGSSGQKIDPGPPDPQIHK
ncbi:PREDICTED: uncharacterized protein LOC109240883 [Nicotiana attenuata]|uniref:uncharacterized protein LOC109240883 n=1 Tax=Nicotiana attenuata TaxID=49451 RepID=UPI000905C4B0|nr:PREDICTED: uncharacterized protein LOC109240883 [Nicotiana attenuata]